MLIATWGWHQAPTFCQNHRELHLAIRYLNLSEEWRLKHPGEAARFSESSRGMLRVFIPPIPSSAMLFGLLNTSRVAEGTGLGVQVPPTVPLIP